MLNLPPIPEFIGVTYAQVIPDINNNSTVYNPNLPSGNGINTITNSILHKFVNFGAHEVTGIVISIMFAFAVLSTMYAGFLYISSRGTDAGPKKAKQIIINVVYGLVLLFCTFIVINLILELATWLSKYVIKT